MAGLNELILLPETIRFVVPSNFVFEARMLHLEFEHVVKIEVRWLELNLAQDGLIVFLDLLQLINSLLRGRRSEPAFDRVEVVFVVDLFFLQLVLVEGLLIRTRLLQLLETFLRGSLSWLSALLVCAFVVHSLCRQAALWRLGDLDTRGRSIFAIYAH